MRASKKKFWGRPKVLNSITNRFYDEAASHGKLDGGPRAEMISERHIVRAYADGNPYHQRRIEEFNPRRGQ